MTGLLILKIIVKIRGPLSAEGGTTVETKAQCMARSPQKLGLATFDGIWLSVEGSEGRPPTAADQIQIPIPKFP